MHSMQPLFIIPHGKQYNAQPMVNGISLTIVQSFTVTCGNAEAIILSESMFLWLFDALPFYNTCLWIPYIVSVLPVSVTRFLPPCSHSTSILGGLWQTHVDPCLPDLVSQVCSHSVWDGWHWLSSGNLQKDSGTLNCCNQTDFMDIIRNTLQKK